MADLEQQTLGTILLVDDMPENLQLLNDLLIQRNYTVRCVTSGKNALKTSKIKPPDVIFLDIKMPEMDGYQTCSAFKKDPDLCDIPIIFISALDETIDKVKAFQVGGVDYITKPFHLAEVIARLENQFTIQRQKKALQNEIIRHQQTQEILYQSRSLLSSLLNTSLDGIISMQAVRDPLTGDIKDFRCLVVNSVISQVIGRNREDIIGKMSVKKFLKLIDPKLFSRFVHVVESGEALKEDIYYPCGNSSWFHLIAVKLGDGLSMIMRDITERKLLEQELRQYERIVSATKDGISLVDRNYIYRVANQTYSEWFQKSNKEIVDHTISDLLGVETFRSLKPHLDQAFAGEKFQYEKWFDIKGVQHFFRVKYFPYLELDGQISGVVINIIDVTDMKKIELYLSELKKKAEEATQAKSEFLANISHEIRTPMNGILGMAQLLQNTPLTERQQAFVQTIYTSSNELLRIVNDVLDFSKIESQMLNLESNHFALRVVLQSVYDLLSQQAIAKNIHLEYTVDETIPELFIGDERCLRQILINLVANSIKFTEKGHVLLAVSAQLLPDVEEYKLTFSIQDTGIGIDGDRLSTLFQPFTQADASITRVYGGTGLGLAICKGLLTTMGGEIWVESRGNIYHAMTDQKRYKNQNDLEGMNYHQGSTFYFSIVFPFITAIAPAQPPPIFELDQNMSEKFPLRILLVEDNPMNQQVMDCIFDTLGYSIDIVNNGVEAIDAVTNKLYDVVFMDIQMPKMDGLMATQKIRSQLEKSPQIIAMTANCLPEDRQKYLEVGMKDHISKPIEIQEIIEILTQCFKDL